MFPRWPMKAQTDSLNRIMIIEILWATWHVFYYKQVGRLCPGNSFVSFYWLKKRSRRGTLLSVELNSSGPYSTDAQRHTRDIIRVFMVTVTVFAHARMCRDERTGGTYRPPRARQTSRLNFILKKDKNWQSVFTSETCADGRETFLAWRQFLKWAEEVKLDWRQKCESTIGWKSQVSTGLTMSGWVTGEDMDPYNEPIKRELKRLYTLTEREIETLHLPVFIWHLHFKDSFKVG